MRGKGEKMNQETKCPDCGNVLRVCCIQYVLAGRPAPESSELQKLLYKNAYGVGLTVGEWNRAMSLIAHSEFSADPCRICKTGKAIFDTGLCQNDALYALNTHK